MKYLRLLLLFIIIVESAIAQPGSVSGNVYWKYNDYVGNKADAGSDIKLISLINPTTSYKSKCDLQGNYKIEDVTPGRYLLIIKSFNTKQNPARYMRLFSIYKQQLDTAFGTNVSNFRIDIQSEIDSIYKRQMDLVQDYAKKMSVWNSSKYLKQNAKIEKALHGKIKSWFEVMPDNLKEKLNTYYYIHESFYYQIIEIQPNKNETVVTDFGITYL